MPQLCWTINSQQIEQNEQTDWNESQASKCFSSNGISVMRKPFGNHLEETKYEMFSRLFGEFLELLSENETGSLCEAGELERIQ